MVELYKKDTNILAFKLKGDITKSDYTILVPEVQKAVDEYGDIKLLLDLSEFRWEDIDAWGSDFHFGETYKKKISKLAIVGDHRWEKWLTKLCTPFYSEQAKYFTDNNDTDALKWLAV